MIAQFDDEYEEPTRDGGIRRRHTITQRTPEDLLKTVVHSQRRIRYLEGKAVPEAHNDGYKKARSELTPQMERLQRDLDEAKARIAAAVQQPAPQAAPAQQAAAAPAVAETARKTLAETLKALEGVSADDMVEQTPKLASGLKDAVAVIEDQNQRLLELSRTIAELKAGKTTPPPAPAQPQAVAQPAQSQAPAPDAQQQEAVRRWQEACRLVDGYVAAPTCATELRLDQGFDEATNEALAFHQELAMHWTQKPRSEITDTDTKAAVAAYLSGNPQLVQRVNAAGAQEPRNYQKWVMLDQVDALRSGLYRDPRTKEWKQRYGQDTGRPVQFPDMQSAYAEFLRLTGKDKAQTAAAVRENTRQMVDAITRRDNGLIQMDTSRTLQGDAAVEATVKQAEEFVATHDYEEIAALARRGTREPWDQYNAALMVLGQEPLPESMVHA
jgi:hypothetical protein